MSDFDRHDPDDFQEATADERAEAASFDQQEDALDIDDFEDCMLAAVPPLEILAMLMEALDYWVENESLGRAEIEAAGLAQEWLEQFELTRTAGVVEDLEADGWQYDEDEALAVRNASVFSKADDGVTALWTARCTIGDTVERFGYGLTPAQAMNELEAQVGRIQWMAKPDPSAVAGEMVQASATTCK